MKSVMPAEDLENAKQIVTAAHLPVMADPEKGYGSLSEACGEKILLAAKTGLVGGSIEKETGGIVPPIYDVELAIKTKFLE